MIRVLNRSPRVGVLVNQNIPCQTFNYRVVKPLGDEDDRLQTVTRGDHAVTKLSEEQQREGFFIINSRNVKQQMHARCKQWATFRKGTTKFLHK